MDQEASTNTLERAYIWPGAGAAGHTRQRPPPAAMFARAAVFALLAAAVAGQQTACSSDYLGDVSNPLNHLPDRYIGPGPPDSDITIPENLCFPLRHVGTVVTVCEDAPPAPAATLYDLTHGHVHRSGYSYATRAVLRVGYKCA